MGRKAAQQFDIIEFSIRFFCLLYACGTVSSVGITPLRLSQVYAIRQTTADTKEPDAVASPMGSSVREWVSAVR